MADLLGQGDAWLERQRQRHLTVPVRYRRPASGSTPAQEASVRATVGRTAFTVAAGGGSVVETVESRDYLIGAEALADFGPPRRGDLVIEVTGGQRHTAEVLAPGREPHWRWSDSRRTCFRIHTKHLTSEPAP